jgi:hypothetical protein
MTLPPTILSNLTDQNTNNSETMLAQKSGKPNKPAIKTGKTGNFLRISRVIGPFSASFCQ